MGMLEKNMNSCQLVVRWISSFENVSFSNNIDTLPQSWKLQQYSFLFIENILIANFHITNVWRQRTIPNIISCFQWENLCWHAVCMCECCRLYSIHNITVSSHFLSQTASKLNVELCIWFVISRVQVFQVDLVLP